MNRRNFVKPCNFGDRCNKLHDADHRSRFSHPNNRAQSGGSPNGFYSNSSKMKFQRSVPIKPVEVAYLYGKNKANKNRIEEISGAVLEIREEFCKIFGNSESVVDHAEDLVARSIATRPQVYNKIREFGENYGAGTKIMFVKAPPALMGISSLPAGKSPHVVKLTANSDKKRTLMEYDHVASKIAQELKKLEEHDGRIKFQVRFGKTVFTDLSDDNKQSIR